MNRISHIAFSFATACGLLLVIGLSVFFRDHFKEMLGDREPPVLTELTTHSAFPLAIALALYLGYSSFAAIRFTMTTKQVILHAAISFLVLHLLFLIYGLSFALPYVTIITSLRNSN